MPLVRHETFVAVGPWDYRLLVASLVDLQELADYLVIAESDVSLYLFHVFAERHRVQGLSEVSAIIRVLEALAACAESRESTNSCGISSLNLAISLSVESLGCPSPDR